MCIFFYNIDLCLYDKYLIFWNILRKLPAKYGLMVYDIEFTALCWSAASSSHHLNQFRGGGQGPLGPLQYANAWLGDFMARKLTCDRIVYGLPAGSQRY